MRDDCWPDFLARRAVSHARRPALIAGSVRWTFAELNEVTNACAAGLAASGAREGSRVALLARNSPAYVVVTHALGRLNAVLLPLNLRLTPLELAWQLEDAEVDLLLHDAEHAGVVAAIVREAPRVHPLILGPHGLIDVAGKPIPGPGSIAADAGRTIIFTSGTTGRPKGALLTYGNFVSSAIGSALHLGHHRDDRWLAALPLFHVGGLAILYRSIVYGIPVVLHAAFDPSAVNDAIDADGVTIVSVVAFMLQRMLDARGEQPYPETLRCVLLGGSSSPPSLLTECLRRGVPVAPSYGMTEAASQIATLLPDEVGAKPGSAGRPLPLTEVRIEREGSVAPAGQAGEILARGPTIIPGYAGRSMGETAWSGGWLRTGDIGYLDDEGYLYVLDRRDDLIVSGGENVYPAEVEAALTEHPAVQEAAVVAASDARWGQAPVAFITCHPGAEPTDEELLRLCERRLARHKQPKQIHRLESMPRNASGKILRRVLRERLLETPRMTT